jgi:hypothetical protein
MPSFLHGNWFGGRSPVLASPSLEMNGSICPSLDFTTQETLQMMLGGNTKTKEVVPAYQFLDGVLLSLRDSC